MGTTRTAVWSGILLISVLVLTAAPVVFAPSAKATGASVSFTKVVDVQVPAAECLFHL
jgi:hypothetical protein